ncbi:hypothetical protein IWQ60_000445 [Tieghemiomyces parasiticus]|uniref:RCC1-like domain-containing protein n=1 Tax=Tieghemiomyces parasiticus TaxID=78921 RepID=A0A9W8E2R1_9FUNG|nr:hypothetical protein IWQ60_000445 [Tieghemiomyces parasiticus]
MPRLFGWGANLSRLHLNQVAASTGRLSPALIPRPSKPATPATYRTSPLRLETVKPTSVLLTELTRSGLTCGTVGSPVIELNIFSALPELPTDVEVTHLAAGHFFSIVGLRSHQRGEHYLAGFGVNQAGQLGDSWPAGAQPRWTSVQAGLDHSVLLDDTGRVYSMGWGADGQVGLAAGYTGYGDGLNPVGGDLADHRTYRVKKISARADYTLALTSSGHLYVWGNSEYGQGLLGEKRDRILVPERVPDWPGLRSGVWDIAAGSTHSLVLNAERELYVCGFGALGTGRSDLEALNPVRVPWPAENGRIAKVYAGLDYSACVTEEGHLYMWGFNSEFGRLGAGRAHVLTPQRVRLLEQEGPTSLRVLDVALGSHHVLVLAE